VSSEGYFGTRTAESGSSNYNATTYIIRQIMAGRSHVALVKVMAVEGDLLDVQPTVNQLDADGNAIPHGTISGIPFMTLQAGLNAVTMIPEVGDIGLCLFADRDISAVKANKDISNPGSMRQSDMADGLYIGGFLNKTPTQFIDFSADGIRIVSPTKITLEAPDIELTAENDIVCNATNFIVNAKAKFSDTIDADGIITAPDVISGGISGKDHPHRAQGATAITSKPLPA
jgi:hypothetical protein